MNTTLLAHITARATATVCRCPPESDPIGISARGNTTPSRWKCSAACVLMALRSSIPSLPDSPRRIEIGCHGQILIDGLHPGSPRGGGRGHPHRLAIEQDPPAIGLFGPRKAFHQRGFARPVIPDERHYLTGAYLKVGSPQRFHAAVPFDQPFGFQYHGRHGDHPGNID